ncbi:MAG: SDR family NAD(P)-dependent oxidoreductase, partial [Gammaproteobacteria bacterium]
MKDIKAKTAFITGGASGIGLGMARAFSNAGMKVIIADIRQDHLDEVKDTFGKDTEVHTIKLDVSDREAFAAALEESKKTFGKVHVLCNNAGIGLGGPMKLATYDDWDWNMNVNVGGVINGVQTFLPHMLEHGEGGHIVNTASTGGLVVHGMAGLYCTAKFAVVGLSEALHGELGEDGIGVSAFCPGPVQTNIAESGKTRPAHLSNTGYAETDKERQARSSAMSEARQYWMEPLDAGERVLSGIMNNDLYIITHPEFRDIFAARGEAILAAIPDYEPPAKRVETIGFLLSNPIYD